MQNARIINGDKWQTYTVLRKLSHKLSWVFTPQSGGIFWLGNNFGVEILLLFTPRFPNAKCNSLHSTCGVDIGWV